MTPNMGSPSHFHLPKESHRPMDSEAITVDSGAPEHDQRQYPDREVREGSGDLRATASAGRCHGSVLLSGVVAG